MRLLSLLRTSEAKEYIPTLLVRQSAVLALCLSISGDISEIMETKSRSGIPSSAHDDREYQPILPEFADEPENPASKFIHIDELVEGTDLFPMLQEGKTLIYNQIYVKIEKNEYGEPKIAVGTHFLGHLQDSETYTFIDELIQKYFRSFVDGTANIPCTMTIGHEQELMEKIANKKLDQSRTLCIRIKVDSRIAKMASLDDLIFPLELADRCAGPMRFYVSRKGEPKEVHAICYKADGKELKGMFKMKHEGKMEPEMRTIRERPGERDPAFGF